MPATYQQASIEIIEIPRANIIPIQRIPEDKAKAAKKIATTDRTLEAIHTQIRDLHAQYNARLTTHPGERPTVTGAYAAWNILQPFMEILDREELWVLNLNTRMGVIRIVQVYMGTINSSTIRIAEIFRPAIIDNAASIIIAHNHPSGDVTPSAEDVAFTRAMVQAGKLLDIEVLDHVVIGKERRYTSLKERGLAF